MTRQYSSTSNATTISGTINSTVTTLTVATGTGAALLGGVTLAAGNVDIFTVAIDPDTVNEEIVYVTQRSGDTLTINRGQAGTGTPGVSGISHTSGAAIKHVLTSDDLIFFRNNASPVASFAFSGSTSGTTTVQATAVADTNTLTLPATSNDTLVGKATTDTLTNKTLSSATLTGTLTAGGGAGTNGQVLSSTGTGVQWSNASAGDVTLTGTQTLTNKTLTSPVLNDPKLNLTLNANTATTYTFVLADNGKLVTSNNASAQTLSIPTNASVAFPIGTQINVAWITGAGQPTINAVTSGTTTILSTGATSTAPKLRVVNSVATCIKVATDTWLVTGDIA
jgi:hypothetical protein